MRYETSTVTQSSDSWEMTLMVLFTLSQNSLYDLRVMPCSRLSPSQPFFECHATRVTGSQTRNVLKDDSLIKSDHYYVTLTPSIQFWTKWMGNSYPASPPNQGSRINGAFWIFRGFVLDLEGWGFSVPFSSVQDWSSDFRNSRNF